MNDDTLSELSSWTGESIVLNTKTNQQQHPQTMYKQATLPDKERLLEDILVLRQTRNVNEEQIRILKVQYARLKKYVDKLEDQVESYKMDQQPEWVKYKEPQQAIQKVTDIEGANEEIRKLKG